MATPQDQFLVKAAAAAAASGHIFPEYAACEAALSNAEKPATRRRRA